MHTAFVCMEDDDKAALVHRSRLWDRLEDVYLIDDIFYKFWIATPSNRHICKSICLWGSWGHI